MILDADVKPDRGGMTLFQVGDREQPIRVVKDLVVVIFSD